MTEKKFETVVFGSGCFWCSEAVFKRLRGVESVVPGYAGGERPNPTYEQVCTGVTGHAEVIKITYDPAVISYDDLLEVLFHTHDPTSLNRQGNDVGTQYRSAIFWTTPEQKEATEKAVEKLNAEHRFDSPVVTEVKPLEQFYEAEQYHHDYFSKNPEQAYCQWVIAPKVGHFKEKFASLLRG